MVRPYSPEKNHKLILSAENIMHLLALTHLVYNEFYNHQLFFISVKFTRKSVTGIDESRPEFFLEKAVLKDFGKFPRDHLFVDRQQIYKN